MADFRILICSITSVTCVFSFTQMFVFLSRHVIVSILLSISIFVCAAASFFLSCLVLSCLVGVLANTPSGIKRSGLVAHDVGLLVVY